MSNSIPNGWHFRQGPVARQFRSPATWFILATTIGVYFLQLYFVFFLHSGAFDRLFAYNSFSFQHGDWWQIWTYAWLHSEHMPFHILLNVWMIFILGPVLERTIGTMRFIIFYLLAAPLSVLTFDLWHLGENVSLVGASGCAFALLTAVAVQFPHRQVTALILFVFKMRMRLLTLAIVICVIEAVMLWFGWLPFIAHTAHLGGAVVGVALGFLFRPEDHTRINSQDTRRQLEAQIGGRPADAIILPPRN